MPNLGDFTVEQIKSAKEVCTPIVAAIGWGFGLWKWHSERKAKKRLAEIIRRGTGPYYQLETQMVIEVQMPEPGWFWNPSQKNVLCSQVAEVGDIGDGSDVVLVVRNSNGFDEAVWAKCTLDGQEIKLGKEPVSDHANALEYFHYLYRKADHGKTQELVLTFQTTSGVQASHRYETKHGMRHLRRIDPT